MSKEQIEEMARIIDNMEYNAYEIGWASDPKADSDKIAEALYNAGYRKQNEVGLREEITTDGFENLELAKERGWYRKKFYCPNCDLLIKIETWDSKRMFGGGTILKSNEMPKYCPNCGAKMKGGEQ